MTQDIIVELAIEDRLLADRIQGMLHELAVGREAPDTDALLIAITDALPPPEIAGPTILLSDDVDPLLALRAGFAAVLPTSAESADLRIALDAAARGLAVAALRAIEETADEALEAWDRGLPADAFHLTTREREVLSLLAQGASNKEIARKLGISVHTAKFHVASLLEKLDSTGRTDAVAQAVRLGILML